MCAIPSFYFSISPSSFVPIRKHRSSIILSFSFSRATGTRFYKLPYNLSELLYETLRSENDEEVKERFQFWYFDWLIVDDKIMGIASWKILEAHNVRDWLRVIAANKDRSLRER